MYFCAERSRDAAVDFLAPIQGGSAECESCSIALLISGAGSARNNQIGHEPLDRGSPLGIIVQADDFPHRAWDSEGGRRGHVFREPKGARGRRDKRDRGREVRAPLHPLQRRNTSVQAKNCQ